MTLLLDCSETLRHTLHCTTLFYTIFYRQQYLQQYYEKGKLFKKNKGFVTMIYTMMFLVLSMRGNIFFHKKCCSCGKSYTSFEYLLCLELGKKFVVVGWHSGPKSWCTVPKLNRSFKMDKSMSKILTKL